MQSVKTWSYKPYTPANRAVKLPYICRMEPCVDGVELQWLSKEPEQSMTVFVKERQGTETVQYVTQKNSIQIHGLKERCDYEVWLRDSNGETCEKRLFQTANAPGVVVNYLHPDDKHYAFSGNFLCSPSIVRSPKGALLISMDVYRKDHAQNLTLIFRSEDEGKSWQYVTDLFPCFWGKMFVQQGKLFMLAASTEYGDLLIGCSEDDGETWCQPTVLDRGSGTWRSKGYHRAPCQVVRHKGRIWTSVEFGCWGEGFSNAILSADENADLLDAESWSISGWNTAEEERNAIEGCMTVLPDGSLVNILRYQENQALMLQADTNATETKLGNERAIPFPMAHTKFEVLRKEDTYYAVGNTFPMRNVLSLYQSRDAEQWELVDHILDYSHCDSQLTAFQYPSCMVEGEELLLASRTAFGGAASYHDSNYCTFHRVRL